jgi:D-3-phosphoglycerate dehydrogenase
MHRILVADDIARDGVDYLQSQPDCSVEVMLGLKEPELCERVREVDALIVRSATRVTRNVLAAAARLKVVGRAGIGVDNIDVTAATELGIVVMNTPEANANSAAELAIAHLFSLCRRLPAADRSVRAGEWKRMQFTGAEVAGKTLGIIGFGNIGRIVAARGLGLKMRVLCHDPFVTAGVFEEQGLTAADLDTLLAQSDFVTLHCPLIEATRNLLSAEKIAKMKPAARLINCARGGLVDERALYEALKSGHLAGAALDVFEQEPPGASPLFELPDVEFTPHLGASTAEAQYAVGVEIAQMTAAFLRNGETASAVNLPRMSSEQAARLRPYQTVAQQLGRLLARMAPTPLEHLEVSLHGQAAALDPKPVAVEALIGFLREHHAVTVNRVNAAHIARQQGIVVSESRSEGTHDYVSLLRVSGRFGSERITLAGTLFDERHPRLVRINDYELEVVLEGHLLFTRHQDRPGVVGALGALLGDAGINIARMQIGLAPGSDQAVAALGIATPLTDEQLARVRAIPAVNKALQISL